MSNKTKARRVANPKSVTILIYNIPAEVKQKFKTACAGRGKHMRETIINFMADFGNRKSA